LKYGTHLRSPGGQSATVAGGWTPRQQDGWMWDLTVPGNNDHDFYVIAGAASTLVHNDNGCSRAARLAGRVIQRAQNGSRSLTSGYHGRLPADLETDIMANPDAVYQSEGSAGRFIFRQGENITVTEGPGSSVGKLVTSYGPAGPRGESGAAIFGGSADDPGLAVTHDMIINGTVPAVGGGTMAPATQIFPDILEGG
jgi:hypothetical protein